MKKQNLKSIIWWLITDDDFLKSARRCYKYERKNAEQIDGFQGEIDLAVKSIVYFYKYGAEK